MRAWVYHGSADLRLEDIPEPRPAAGQVAVRVAYNGICGSDLYEYRVGPVTVPLKEPHPTTGHVGPVTLGHEASGTIVAIGEGVTGIEISTRVAIEPIVRRPGDDAAYNVGAAFYGLQAPGFLADTAIVQASAVHRLTDAVGLREGALAEPLAVAWHALDRGVVTSEDAVVVFGGGPIGIGSALSARARGVQRLVVAELSADRRAVLEKLGLTTVDPAAGDVREAITTVLGGPATVAVDAAGASAAVSAAVGVLAPRGRLVLVAAHAGPMELDGLDLVSRARNPVKICGESFEDLVGGLGPGEGSGVVVPGLDPVADVAFEGLEVLVDPAAELLVGQ